MDRYNYDWDAVRIAYITGSESLRQVAARFGVSIRETAKHSSEEGWVQQREDHRKAVAVEAQRAALRAQSESLAAIWNAQDLLDKAVVLMAQKLAEGDLSDVIANGTPGREIESLTKAAANLLEIAHARFGILSPRDEARLKLDREKLEFEKAKQQAEIGADKTVKVVFDAGLEELAK